MHLDHAASHAVAVADEEGAQIESAPENRGAPFNVRQYYLRSLLLDFDSLAVADRDLARLLGLGDLAHQSRRAGDRSRGSRP